MGASHSYSPRNRDDCNMNPVIVHVDSDFETDDVVDIPEQIDSAHVATNTTETEKHSITTKPEKLGISYDDIEEIVSMYLGPKMVFDQSLNASCISQISRPSTTLMEAMTLEYDNYYDDCERRLYEVPRPKPPADHNQEPLRIAWQKGELLGSGAFGSVYLGLNTDEGKWFAAKQVSLAPNCEAQSTDANQFVQALVQEIYVLKTLKQENIVQYLGTQRDNENLYIFLEFVPGGSIASIIKRFGKFKETLVSKYTRQILLGLEYLHRHQIMHRDIKGANILVDTNGVCKLADFGAAARLADITQAQRKTIQGTPFWMAPEVIKQTGHGRQADIWSVGCTVIEMVTGKPPWHQLKTPIAALFHIAAAVEPPELPPTLSPELRDFILLCMQRDPNKRPNATKLLQHPFLMNNENVTTNIESPGESILPADAAAIQDFLSQTATSQLKVIRSKSSKDDVPSSSAANNEPHDSVLSNHSCSRRQSL